MDPDGLAFPARKITLSTSGVVPKIEACGRELGVGLAISLHAVRDELRDQLVPINRKWNIAALLDACRAYRRRPTGITFEYVMLDGVNDSDADARELVRLIRGIPAKVNLIPFNPWPGAPYRCSPPERIRAFAAIVARAGYPAPVRTPRGRDILAACGQLKTASERQRRSRRRRLRCAGCGASWSAPGRVPRDDRRAGRAGGGRRRRLRLAAAAGRAEPARAHGADARPARGPRGGGRRGPAGGARGRLAAPTLTDVVMALDQAARDARVAGLLARLDGEGPGLAQRRSCAPRVARFRAQGKFAYAHADSFGEFGPGNARLLSRHRVRADPPAADRRARPDRL